MLEAGRLLNAIKDRRPLGLRTSQHRTLGAFCAFFLHALRLMCPLIWAQAPAIHISRWSVQALSWHALLPDIRCLSLQSRDGARAGASSTITLLVTAAGS
ncbi:hypothetical protein BV25DRAFT_1041393 [Artomyces pyxidatus]|uniref:Uncharacterized protein n=1 Tax=Artomyces pyxidatus TaxID=48021 RepID=A0ACB8SVE9_9AGAM|nr:hypothetical protein BV25DRAFT_1041393 [Artomyces pyxidatus]